ncbi:MAG: NAD(P)H-dependent oxidoreductase subunit E [Candidatus Aureabacteria bacterium]|nr:NAD(P)H-dependent oxidoreductase subunit E [Candidatus Auribacterota bacterium]
MKYLILLIDDDSDFVEATRLLLEANDYKVITAKNGQEGFQKVKKESPNLIILDMMMTYKTEGAETAKAITADASTKDIPLIMITGARKEFSFPFELKANQPGLPVKVILEKPVDPEHLLKTVALYIAKRGDEPVKKQVEVKNLINKWQDKEGNLIMILHELQNYYGYIPRDVAFNLTRDLGIPLARIYEVISFYHYFQLEPPGKHIISVCMGTACYLKGATQLFKELKDILNIEEGEITKDGLFQLKGVRCIGCCGLAPVIMIDEKVYGNLKAGDLMDIISQYSNKSEKSVKEGVVV